jgi:methionyl-tRNA synthetase
MTSTYITTTIPYVNARPHLGFALELVQADVLARHHRGRGERVRFQAGTDDNSLKNVLAAQAAGRDVQEFVDANAAAFTGLARPLNLSVDDLIRTSSDPRHAAGVERFWRACAARGDLYRRHYEGLYCVGCEQFYPEAELSDGRCPEHGTVPDLVSEENWFFRLSRYAGQLRALIADGTIRIEPAGRRNEVLALIDGGLDDFSVSRSVERARGWGIPVPGDPGQVIYVWWDALGNYLTALDYAAGGENQRTWWTCAGKRIHLLGKGVLRFHAVYWPAMLLSAGETVPTDIVVHGYLTASGRKISKSSGATVDPYALVDEYGTDAVRWWLLREVPKGADADFTVERLVSRADDELANGFGNLVNRVVSMIHRYYGGRVPTATTAAPEADALNAAIGNAPVQVAAALGDFDFRRATEAVWRIADEANRYVNRTRPWALAKAGDSAGLAAVLLLLLTACQSIGTLLGPFLPQAASRITEQVTPNDSVLLSVPSPVFPRLGSLGPAASAAAELGGESARQLPVVSVAGRLGVDLGEERRDRVGDDAGSAPGQVMAAALDEEQRRVRQQGGEPVRGLDRDHAVGGIGDHQHGHPDRCGGGLKLTEFAQQGALLGEEGAPQGPAVLARVPPDLQARGLARVQRPALPVPAPGKPGPGERRRPAERQQRAQLADARRGEQPVQAGEAARSDAAKQDHRPHPVRCQARRPQRDATAPGVPDQHRVRYATGV